jgi:hypothetical protein
LIDKTDFLKTLPFMNSKMTSKENDTKHSKDKKSYYRVDKDNDGYYFEDKGTKFYLVDKSGNKIGTPNESKEEKDIDMKNLSINKLCTHLMKILWSCGYINENISSPNVITNTIKIELNKFTNPGSSRCKAIISNNNGNYRCNAPVKLGSEYCGRKHKKIK